MIIVAYTIDLNKAPISIRAIKFTEGLKNFDTNANPIAVSLFKTDKEGLQSFINYLVGTDTIIESASASKYTARIMKANGIKSNVKYQKIRYSLNDLVWQSERDILIAMANKFLNQI